LYVTASALKIEITVIVGVIIKISSERVWLITGLSYGMLMF
jgi:hypothetical protein